MTEYPTAVPAAFGSVRAGASGSPGWPPVSSGVAVDPDSFAPAASGTAYVSVPPTARWPTTRWSPPTDRLPTRWAAAMPADAAVSNVAFTVTARSYPLPTVPVTRA